MRLSVLVPTWQRPDDLGRCLDALAAQTRAPDEVLVVVRTGDEQSERVVARAAADTAAPRLVRVERAGVVAALNAGLEACGGDVVCITDDDTVPRHDWLARIAAYFEADSRLGALGGRDFIHGLPGVDTEPRATVGVVTHYGRLIGNHHLGVGAAREVDVLKGANLSLRRKAVEGTPVDERLRGQGAQAHFEVALCLALKRAGWRVVYDPAVAIDHYPAVRFGDDQRFDPSLPALANAVHNETYVLLRWLPPLRKAVVLGYSLLVGSRRAPGPLLALERLARGEPARRVGARTRVASRARLAGLHTALTASREAAAR